MIIQPEPRRISMLLPTVWWLGWLLPLLFACSGCLGKGPSAVRGRSLYDPSGVIDFVEHGQRSKGVLVSATQGYSSAFSASWATMLVPIPPTALDGPVWSSDKATVDEALAIAALPHCRNEVNLRLFADLVRWRFHQLSVWILSTDPLIVGLPAGDPKRTWREFAVAETGSKPVESSPPVPSVIARFVVKGELDQPLASVAVFPADFWERESAGGSLAETQLALVHLSKPFPIDAVLDALASGEPARLGKVETVSLYEQFPSIKETGRSYLEDQEHLMAR